MNGTGHWILSDDDPPREIEVDLMTWAIWFEENPERRQVRSTQVRRGEVEGPWVSTIFIGLYYGLPPPVLYETMVFACRNEWHEPSPVWPEGHWGLGESLDEAKHSTWSKAVTGHERMVQRWGERWWAEHGDQA